MFIIDPETNDDLAAAMMILSHFHVIMRVYSDTETIASMFIEVFDEGREGDLNLAEQAFQMSFIQKKESAACPLCSKYEDYCGHLVFTKTMRRVIKNG
jgi:hypothetical protein